MKTNAGVVGAVGNLPGHGESVDCLGKFDVHPCGLLLIRFDTLGAIRRTGDLQVGDWPGRVVGCMAFCGRGGTRTCDLTDVNRAL